MIKQIKIKSLNKKRKSKSCPFKIALFEYIISENLQSPPTEHAGQHEKHGHEAQKNAVEIWHLVTSRLWYAYDCQRKQGKPLGG